MECAYKFRLYPTKAQAQLIQKTFGCARFIYNYYLDVRKTAYEKQRKIMSEYDCSLELTQLKKKLDWLREVDCNALRLALKDLDNAYQSFFHQVMCGEKPEYPKFKSKKEHKKSYRTKNEKRGGIKLFPGHVQLPKLGKVRCKISKEVKGRILNATITQTPSGKYFISITCTDVEFNPLPKTGNAVGLDVGIKTFVTTSDGTKYPNHKYLAKSQKKLAKLQRQLSRKSSGSANWEKARIKVARLCEHIANQRNDTLHKLSTELVRKYDTICVETLNIQGMMHNSSLAGYIGDASWYKFRHQLEYKARWYGKRTIAIDQMFPSTMMCSCCGEVTPDAHNLKVREWTCPHCGSHHDRDVNAAINILNEGLRLLA